MWGRSVKQCRTHPVVPHFSSEFFAPLRTGRDGAPAVAQPVQYELEVLGVPANMCGCVCVVCCMLCGVCLSVHGTVCLCL